MTTIETKTSPLRQRMIEDMNLRKMALDGHILQCQSCNHVRIAYNSCLMGSVQ